MVYRVGPSLRTSTTSSASFNRGCNAGANLVTSNSAIQQTQLTGPAAQPNSRHQMAGRTFPIRPFPLIACRMGAGRTSLSCAEDAISGTLATGYGYAGTGVPKPLHRRLNSVTLMLHLDMNACNRQATSVLCLMRYNSTVAAVAVDPAERRFSEQQRWSSKQRWEGLLHDLKDPSRMYFVRKADQVTVQVKHLPQMLWRSLHHQLDNKAMHL